MTEVTSRDVGVLVLLTRGEEQVPVDLWWSVEKIARMMEAYLFEDAKGIETIIRDGASDLRFGQEHARASLALRALGISVERI